MRLKQTQSGSAAALCRELPDARQIARKAIEEVAERAKLLVQDDSYCLSKIIIANIVATVVSTLGKVTS